MTAPNTNDMRTIVRDDLITLDRWVVELPTGVLVVARTPQGLKSQLLAIGYSGDGPCVLKTQLDLDTRPREHKDSTGDVQFFERSSKIDFGREFVSDADLEAALRHAAAKFGPQLRLSGEDEVFTKRMAKMAVELGFEVMNPELQGYIESLPNPRKNVIDFRAR